MPIVAITFHNESIHYQEVYTESVHQECLFNDPCCGCPSKIDLIISDSQTIFTPGTEGLLRLVDSERQAFCQRVPLSCEYRCGNWVEGAIYDVTGTLSVELAPAGSGVKHPLKYYFQVESEKMIRKVGPMDLLGSLLEEIGSLWRKIKIPRYYLLPR